MSIGKMQRPIKVKSTLPGVRDEAGGTSNGAEIVVFETRADVEQKSSAWKQLQGIQVLGNVYVMKIRYSSERNINTTNIIEYEGKNLGVHGYNEKTERRKRFIEITAYEQSLGGAGDGGSGGGGNYNPDGSYKWEKGTALEEVPAGYTKMYQFSYSSFGAQGITWEALNGSVIDWGDDTGIWQYPDGVSPLKPYSIPSGDIKVYHNDTPTELVLQSRNGNGICTAVTGDIPIGLRKMLIADKLPTFPTYPSTLLTVGVGATEIPAAELTEMVDVLIAAGLTGGRCEILVTINGERQYVATEKLNVLRGRQWDVIEWRDVPGDTGPA
jgi:hypothetical protein